MLSIEPLWLSLNFRGTPVDYFCTWGPKIKYKIQNINFILKIKYVRIFVINNMLFFVIYTTNNSIAN